MKQDGFSLIEAIVTVAILGVLVALATPNLLAWSANQSLRSFSSELQGDLQIARMTAINRSAPVTLRFNTLPPNIPAPNRYFVFVDDGSGGGTARDLIQNGSEPTILVSRPAANGVSFNTINVAGGGVLFNGRGLRARPVLNPADVIVQNSVGKQYQIFISLTGDINANIL
ncbi:MAG: GspH/FimT family pseudopilin [Nitrospiria bacterium]